MKTLKIWIATWGKLYLWDYGEALRKNPPVEGDWVVYVYKTGPRHKPMFLYCKVAYVREDGRRVLIKYKGKTRTEYYTSIRKLNKLEKFIFKLFRI